MRRARVSSRFVPYACHVATGQVLTKIAAATANDVDVAVKAARHAFKTAWGQKVAAYDRGRLLYKLADLLEKNVEEFSALEALDAGQWTRFQVRRA